MIIGLIVYILSNTHIHSHSPALPGLKVYLNLQVGPNVISLPYFARPCLYYVMQTSPLDSPAYASKPI